MFPTAQSAATCSASTSFSQPISSDACANENNGTQNIDFDGMLHFIGSNHPSPPGFVRSLSGFDNSSGFSTFSHSNTYNSEDTLLSPASPIVVDKVSAPPAAQKSGDRGYTDFLGRPPDDETESSLFNSLTLPPLPISGLIDNLLALWQYPNGSGASLLSTDDICRSFIPSNSPLMEMTFEPMEDTAQSFFQAQQPALSHSPSMSVDSPALPTPASAVPFVATSTSHPYTVSTCQSATTGLGLQAAFEQPSHQAQPQSDMATTFPAKITGWQPEEGNDSLMSVDIMFDAHPPASTKPREIHGPVVQHPGCVGQLGENEEQAVLYTSVQDTSKLTVTEVEASGSAADVPANNGFAGIDFPGQYAAMYSPMEVEAPIVFGQNVPEPPSSSAFAFGHAGTKPVDSFDDNSVLCASNTVGRSPPCSGPSEGYPDYTTSPTLVQPTPVSFMLSTDAAADILSSLEAGTLAQAHASPIRPKSQLSNRQDKGKTTARSPKTSPPRSSSNAASVQPKFRFASPAQEPTPKPPPKARSKPSMLHRARFVNSPIPTQPRPRNVRSFVPLELAKRITQQSMRELEEEREAERRRVEEMERREDEDRMGMESEERGEKVEGECVDGEEGVDGSVMVAVRGRVMVWSKQDGGGAKSPCRTSSNSGESSASGGLAGAIPSSQTLSSALSASGSSSNNSNKGTMLAPYYTQPQGTDNQKSAKGRTRAGSLTTSPLKSPSRVGFGKPPQYVTADSPVRIRSSTSYHDVTPTPTPTQASHAKLPESLRKLLTVPRDSIPVVSAPPLAQSHSSMIPQASADASALAPVPASVQLQVPPSAVLRARPANVADGLAIVGLSTMGVTKRGMDGEVGETGRTGDGYVGNGAKRVRIY